MTDTPIHPDLRAPLDDVCHNIRDVRTLLNLSQRDVALRMGVTVQTYQKWERPNAGYRMSLWTLARIATALHVEPYLLMMRRTAPVSHRDIVMWSLRRLPA